LGDSAVGLTLRFRLEETRLSLWAKNRGIDIQENQESASSETQPRKDDILEIPAVRQLVAEILGRMLQVLDRYTKIKDKYKSLQSDQIIKDI
jgi:hypothetical protein